MLFIPILHVDIYRTKILVYNLLEKNRVPKNKHEQEYSGCITLN